MEAHCTVISYRQTNSFSDLVNDYLDNEPLLRKFFAFTADFDGIGAAIERRKNYSIDRQALVNTLQRQYSALPEIPQVQSNIEALSQENTYTVCTAHQPNLLSGYLYFFYKIIHAIKLAETLRQEFPGKKFVPVYYMGSEDNDLDELGQFRYGNEKYRWDADGQTGAVGRMQTKSLKPLLEKLFRKLGPPGKNLDELTELISASYLKHSTIAEATRYLVHQLFGQYGLIVLNPDDAAFKEQFTRIIKDDLFNHSALPIVSAQSALLAETYKAQAFPREINLFYLKDDIRERIEKDGAIWKVLNTEIQFSKSELEEELKGFPERFSPNVILRGLFQETILPDVCFIGGGSELAYWLQLKPLFEHYNVFYPVILLRQSVQILSPQVTSLITKLGLDINQIFEPTATVLKDLIVRDAGEQWSVEKELNNLFGLFLTLREKAKSIDATLEKASDAVLTKIEKQIKILEQKMYRAEKRKHNVVAERLDALHKEIYPAGGLQERVENFMPYFLEYGFELFETIKNNIDPIDNQFLIINPK